MAARPATPSAPTYGAKDASVRVETNAAHPSASLSDAPSPRAEPTKVLLKGLAVLEAMLAHDGEAGISEIARATDIDKATVHRLVNTLRGAGYIARVDPGRRYRLTDRMARFAPRKPRSLMELALPRMRRLVDTVNETVYVAVPNGDDAVFLDKIEGDQTIRVHTVNGSRIPLWCGSAAKTLLAYSSPEVIERVAARLDPVTSYTITRPAALYRELKAIRTAGYAIGEQEWRIGVSGVAAPVRDASGGVAAALGISGPSDRLGRATLKRLAPFVVATADEIGYQLGYRPASGDGQG